MSSFPHVQTKLTWVPYRIHLWDIFTYTFYQIFIVNINHPCREIYNPIDPIKIVRASQPTPSEIRVSFSALSRETNAEKTPDKNKAGGSGRGTLGR